MAATKKKTVQSGVAALALAVAAHADGPDIKMSPLHFGAVHEAGLFERGLTFKEVSEFNDEWMDHFGSFLSQEAVVNDRLVLKAGLGGVFMFPKPEAPDEEFGGSQFKAFYVGPTIAEAMYHFGGVENSMFSLGGGMFPYKYNPDASNLGEYLFRSIPYPTVLQTGGLTAIGGNAAVLQALRASVRAGGFSADMLLSTETSMPPLYNGSLAFVAGYKIMDGLVDLGGGVNFRHLLQVRPSKSAKTDRENTEFKVKGVWYAGEERYYSLPAEFLDGKIQANIADGNAANDGDTVAIAAERDRLKRLAFLVKNETTAGGWRIPGTTDWIDSSTGRAASEEHYSSAGTMVMGRIAVDLKKVIPSERCAPADFRIYAEAAVLGLKNYNIYYKKWTDRMPIMFGVNIPTYGVLDLFAVQVEQFKSPNLNNFFPIGNKNWNIPYLPEAQDKVHSRESYNDLTLEDDYAWSILLQKRFWSAFSVSAQIARDHHRTFANEWFFGSRFDPAEMTHRGPGYFDFAKSSWYWMLQLGWNI
jgi:hypothetical protein